MQATRLDVIEQQQRSRAARRDALIFAPLATLGTAYLAYAAAQFFIA